MNTRTIFAEKGWLLTQSRLTLATLSTLRNFVSRDGAGKRLNALIGHSIPTEFQNELESLSFSPTIQRAVAFCKTPDSNWSLPWHQDRVVTMTEKSDDPTFSNWSRKAGVWHCEPSVERLESMAFLYIALDEMGEGAGRLEIAEGTHRSGKIAASDVETQAERAKSVKPTLQAGEALLVHALTLHRSGQITEGSIRRAIRFDLVASALSPLV